MSLLPTFLLLLLLVSSSSARNATTTRMNEWPMIMAHDAATTYLPSTGLVNPWTKTQPDGGTAGLLNCGARAFDWRPSLQADGSLVMHHGSITVKYDMSKAIDEMITWAGNNKNGASDLILLGVTDCEGASNGTTCTEAVNKVLAARNISIVTATDLATMTVAGLTMHGRLSNGGAMLACHSCWQMNYNPAVACSGFGDSKEEELDLDLDDMMSLQPEQVESLTYTCYADSKTKMFPLERMWQYLSASFALVILIVSRTVFSFPGSLLYRQ